MRSRRAPILLVPASYAPVAGGVQSVTRRLAGALSARGHNVIVITQRYPLSLPACEMVDGISVRRWPFLFPRLRDLVRGRIDLFMAGVSCGPLVLARLLVLLTRSRPSVVNVHFAGVQAPFMLAARSVIRFRLVVSLHGDDVEGLPRGTWFDRAIFRAVLRRADVVTGCSRFLLDEALAIEPGAGAKARVVYNGFDVEKQTNVPGRSLVAAGRLVPMKGLDVLLRALALCDGVQLEVVGDGPERPGLEALARDVGVSDRVVFRGRLGQNETVQALASARIVVVPSRRESFGLVALEAMAVGRPVIASQVGGLAEVLAGADAELVPPEDPPALARAIRLVLAQVEKDPSYGRRNVELAARFSTSAMVGAYEAAYQSAAGRCA